MNLTKFYCILLVLAGGVVSAQVKIGENPNRIDAASIIELESSQKAFVLTRVTEYQMQQIQPLRGALVYNTEAKCVYYYNGSAWSNLCNGAAPGKFTFTSNSNGTITIRYSDGSTFTTSSLRGPAGADGADGVDGAQGPKGDKGDTGAIGSVGPQGPQGAKGDTGADGPQGPAWDGMKD